jgi:uncharacterized protein (DUF1501 family)
MKKSDRRIPGTITRRSFVKSLGCGALSVTPLLGTLAHLGGATRAAAQGLPSGDDYRALVCILLAGGNDSFNMIVPHEPDEYDDYVASRSDLALDRDSLLTISPASLDRDFGFHPSMPEVHGLFEAGRLAVINNVGTLVEPVTLSQVASGSGRLPLGLYSHSDQIRQWQTSVPDDRQALGWGGRLADLLGDINSQAEISMGISLAGTNEFQRGAGSSEFAITSEGSTAIIGFGDPRPFQVLRETAIRSLVDAQYQNLLEQAFADRMAGAIQKDEVFSAALAGAPELTTTFSHAPLSQDLRMIAQTMAVREVLGMRRQTFFVLVGGWDHHDEVRATQAPMLAGLSGALAEFDAALGELGVRGDVTTFTISDFGRTLTSNGRGSDHGWGGNQLVMGGAVRGGDFYGTPPPLYPNNDLDTGRGRLIPTLSTDEYFAELALWFGVSTGDLDRVLPNISRFMTASLENPPVGFLLGGSEAPRPPCRSLASASGVKPVRQPLGGV